MEALRLKLFQETACYKKPTAFKVGETYPLPPYSTVKGMLHALLEARQYVPMAISVQGEYESRIVDYQRHYFFKALDVDELPLVLDGLGVSYQYSHMTMMPIYMHMLYRVRLVIHVRAAADVLDGIEKGIATGIPIALGRWEDLVCIEQCERVELERADGELEMPLAMYVPRTADLEETLAFGIPYRLNWTYDIVNGIRQWKRIPVRYINAGNELEGNDLWVDRCPETNTVYPVVFAPEMEG